MGVTRLKRKDRMNKTVSRLWNQMMKKNTDKSIGSRAATPTSKDKQVAANNSVIAKVKAMMA